MKTCTSDKGRLRVASRKVGYDIHEKFFCHVLLSTVSSFVGSQHKYPLVLEPVCPL